MNHILTIYSDDIKRFSNKGSVGFDYTICRAYYSAKNYRQAIKSAILVIYKLPRFILLFKVFITIIASLFFIFTIRFKNIYKLFMNLND